MVVIVGSTHVIINKEEDRGKIFWIRCTGSTSSGPEAKQHHARWKPTRRQPMEKAYCSALRLPLECRRVG